MTYKQLISLVFLLCITPSPSQLTAHPTAGAPYLTAPQLAPRKKATTVFSYGLLETHADQAYDADGTTTPLLSLFGHSDIAALRNGLPAAEAETVTAQYFGGDHDITSKKASLLFQPVSDTSTTTAPKVYRKKKRYFDLTQHIGNNLFLTGSLHFSEEELNAVAYVTGDDMDDPAVVNFLDAVETIAKEHGLGGLQHVTTPQALDHAHIGLGWQEVVATHNPLIQQAGARLMLGYVVDAKKQKHALNPGLLADHRTDGVIASASAMIRPFSFLRLDCHGTTIIHFKRDKNEYIVRDTINAQAKSWYTGPLLLGTGLVQKDPGTTWQVQGAASLESKAGLYVAGGYMFSYQEATTYELADATLFTADQQDPATLFTAVQQYERINSDPKLAAWKNHQLFVRIGFSGLPERYRFSPQISATWTFPLFGSNSAISSSRDINGGLFLSWQF